MLCRKQNIKNLTKLPYVDINMAPHSLPWGLESVSIDLIKAAKSLPDNNVGFLWQSVEDQIGFICGPVFSTWNIVHDA